MFASELGPLCRSRGWSRARLILELRRAATTQRVTLPPDDSLKRMAREWINGRRGLSEFYAELLTLAFGIEFLPGKPAEAPLEVEQTATDTASDLEARLVSASAVDATLVMLLEGQTQSLRLLDRRLGAARLLAQTEAHLVQMSDLLVYSLPAGQRSSLAAAVAETAALAGWQALDLGDATKSWRHHETAKAAAGEANNPAIVAHVTAQQAYALLDLDRAADAQALIGLARGAAKGKVPALLGAWLALAESEAYAACGKSHQAFAAMDDAWTLLPDDPGGDALPFVVLDEVHVERWRGHCLARLGAAEAVDKLSVTIERLDPSFARAAAGVHCDLALAYSVRGARDEARQAATKAAALAAQTASVRQRRRINRLLTSGGGRRGD